MLIRMWRNCIIAGGNVKRLKATLFVSSLKTKSTLGPTIVSWTFVLDTSQPMFKYNVHANVLAAVSIITSNWKQLNIFNE